MCSITTQLIWSIEDSGDVFCPRLFANGCSASRHRQSGASDDCATRTTVRFTEEWRWTSTANKIDFLVLKISMNKHSTMKRCRSRRPTFEDEQHEEKQYIPDWSARKWWSLIQIFDSLFQYSMWKRRPSSKWLSWPIWFVVVYLIVSYQTCAEHSLISRCILRWVKSKRRMFAHLIIISKSLDVDTVRNAKKPTQLENDLERGLPVQWPFHGRYGQELIDSQSVMMAFRLQNTSKCHR